MDTILIIDGLNNIYRAKVKQTEHLGPYNIVFNFIRGLRSLIEQFNPTKVFFVLEGHNNPRYSIYSDYKANRRLIKQSSSNIAPKEDADFKRQRDICIELLQYLPITTVNANYCEGDDIIRSLVENMRHENLTVVSNDSDLIQLLQLGLRDVKLYNPFKKQYVEAPPYLQLIYKAIYGDVADNIPRLLPQKKAQAIAADPSKLSAFLSITEENRANFAINRQLVELRLLPDTELVMQDGIWNEMMLKLRFREMDFISIVRSEYFLKFKETFGRLYI